MFNWIQNVFPWARAYIVRHYWKNKFKPQANHTGYRCRGSLDVDVNSISVGNTYIKLKKKKLLSHEKCLPQTSARYPISLLRDTGLSFSLVYPKKGEAWAERLLISPKPPPKQCIIKLCDICHSDQWKTVFFLNCLFIILKDFLFSHMSFSYWFIGTLYIFSKLISAWYEMQIFLPYLDTLYSGFFVVVVVMRPKNISS